MKKYFFNILVWISVVFLLFYLYKNDLFIRPVVYSVPSLIGSFIILFIAFLIQAVNWQQILKYQYPIKLVDAIASMGLTVFTKYIPGKVMVILGRAGYIKKKYGYPIDVLVSRSFDDQMLSILTGMIFGSFSLFWLNRFGEWGVYLIIFITGLGLALFTPYFHKMLRGVLKILRLKSINVPYLNAPDTLKVIPTFLLYWAVMSLAFYLLLGALLPRDVNIFAGFIFPLANTLGIVFIFAPGGIGVREGILVGLLNASNVDLATATSVAVFSRLWFLAGEIFLFLMGSFMNRKSLENDQHYG